jgi:hypothetical protein
MTRTPITLVREHVEDWRRTNAWSRETAVQQIVEAHGRLGFDTLTGIAFDPPTKDSFERMRVNADRVFRWLDDSTKDRNLLPFNFVWSILAALPAERRLALADALLFPVGLGAQEDPEVHIGVDPAAPDTDRTVVMHFQNVVAAAADAEVALSRMLDGIDKGEPEAAKAKLSRLAAVGQRALGLMSRLLRRPGKVA